MAVAAALGLSGCGGSTGPLDKAEDAMADLAAGRMALALSATAGATQPTAPVGFRVEGPFSYRNGGPLPVLDMRYTRIAAGQEMVTRVVSTGDAMFLVNGEKVTEVPEDQVAGLRLGSGEGGAADLGIAGWVRDPKKATRPDGTRVVSGTANVADLLSDLARIGEGIGTGGRRPAAGAADRLNQLARSSSITVELGEGDLPRSVRAVVNFGASVPKELTEVLGPYAAARLEMTLELERLTEELKVDAPTP